RYSSTGSLIERKAGAGAGVSFEPYVPRLLEILTRVGAEGGERRGSLDSRDLRELLSDDVSDSVILGNANDRDQIPLAGYRIHLCHAVHASECPGDLRNALGIGLDEDDGGYH